MTEPTTRRPRIFVSHAGEDTEVAIELTSAFTRAGIFAWVDRQRLQIGDSLVQSIQEEIGLATHGVIVISEAFLDKPWPKDELRTIYAAYINGTKQLLPLWHGDPSAIKMRLDQQFPGVSDIWAENTSNVPRAVDAVLRKVTASPTGVPLYVPPYEASAYRFFTGMGELTNSEGRAVSVWEYVLMPDEHFPAIINGKSYSRKDLAAKIFEHGYKTAYFTPANWVGIEGVAKVARMLIANGVDADLLLDLEWPADAIRLATE